MFMIDTELTKEASKSFLERLAPYRQEVEDNRDAILESFDHAIQGELGADRAGSAVVSVAAGIQNTLRTYRPTLEAKEPRLKTLPMIYMLVRMEALQLVVDINIADLISRNEMPPLAKPAIPLDLTLGLTGGTVPPEILDLLAVPQQYRSAILQNLKFGNTEKYADAHKLIDQVVSHLARVEVELAELDGKKAPLLVEKMIVILALQFCADLSVAWILKTMKVGQKIYVGNTIH
jgi:hypothetical protein